ncbi:hypothetical protein K1T71_000593 [Dendrolimus kikuchii]|uniref:Uncharacterized protein n=1 Tax=Dendrolimus kikuchii TaxID=765133 RepID=A0ACC1DJT8_9NEOP|nr:hypothetical protein K1T71_000593 [Dendrolimus kikuchii]
MMTAADFGSRNTTAGFFFRKSITNKYIFIPETIPFSGIKSILCSFSASKIYIYTEFQPNRSSMAPVSDVGFGGGSGLDLGGRCGNGGGVGCAGVSGKEVTTIKTTTRSPLQDLSATLVIGPAADVIGPLLLQLANFASYVGYFASYISVMGNIQQTTLEPITDTQTVVSNGKLRNLPRQESNLEPLRFLVGRFGSFGSFSTFGSFGRLFQKSKLFQSLCIPCRGTDIRTHRFGWNHQNLRSSRPTTPVVARASLAPSAGVVNRDLVGAAAATPSSSFPNGIGAAVAMSAPASSAAASFRHACVFCFCSGSSECGYNRQGRQSAFGSTPAMPRFSFHPACDFGPHPRRPLTAAEGHYPTSGVGASSFGGSGAGNYAHAPVPRRLAANRASYIFGVSGARGCGSSGGEVSGVNIFATWARPLSGLWARSRIHHQPGRTTAGPFAGWPHHLVAGDLVLVRLLMDCIRATNVFVKRDLGYLVLDPVLEGSDLPWLYNSDTITSHACIKGGSHPDGQIPYSTLFFLPREIRLRTKPRQGQNLGGDNSNRFPSSGPSACLLNSCNKKKAIRVVNISPPTGSNCESKPSGHPLKHTKTKSPKSLQVIRRILEPDLSATYRLSSSKLPWNDKEKPPEEEGSPRLYPILDKELQNQVSERRASWLTTKMLRKPLSSGNPDVVENSVRELGVRSENNSQDKENVDSLSMSEDENVAPRDLPPHPTGVKLTRPGYYTIPSLDEMIAYMRPDGSCVVPHLIIGRKNYGNIYYDCEVDVARLDLDSLVHFLHKEVIVYPNEEEKPPMGTSLNRRAIITLDRIWPRDKSQRKPITDPDRLLKMDYEAKLRRVCDKHDTKFIEYRPQTGSWVFRVEHFSKYGLTDSDEEDDITPEVMKKQLVSQTLQQSAPPAIATPGGLSSLGGMLSPGGMPGLGGLATLGGVAAQTGGMDGSLYAMQQSSLNLLSGATKAFEMDTTEDNADAQSFYQENRAFGVKSPTSELARLEHRQSHNVQLMKASLYADPEVEDDISLSTGDQQVPMLAPLLAAPLPMKPLIVQPHAIVLKYHRKVPPFKNTIAGKLDAACFADMSVSRARHSRVGFGPSAILTYVTSYDAVNDLPKSSDLSELGKYVRGRAADDWSESVVTRLGIGHTDSNYNIEEVLSRHLATLLEFTTSSVSSEQQCPLAKLDDSPSAKRQVLSAHVRHANEMKERRPAFGITGAYCYEVWKLCEALWGADLDNDGIPGTDELAVVGRHKKLLEWFASAVADATDEELCQPTKGEAEDAADGHSARVWTLLLGGRVSEACRVARENGDLNMAILIAQAAGDPAFRSLVSRQLSQWRECDALQFVSSHRLATLKLVSGEASTLKELHQLDWLRAMHATARYLCPQVPSLEHIIKTYERFFVADEEIADEVNLATVGDEVAMRLPLPDYVHHYEMTTNANTKPRRVLDLRYELMRARALNARPQLQPASYTVDPSDYSLCFLLGTWFGNPTRDSITGVADQLEAAGAWHLAVQALTYHPDDVVRSHLIRGVLSRHAPAKADSSEMKSRLELIRKLGVPDKWVLISQAHRAKYEHNAALEVEHLVAAGEWNAAHKVLIEELLPEAVLADDLRSISPILSRLYEAAQRHEVSGWESGGKALYHYLHVCDEIRDLVSSADAQCDKWSVQARLEALRPTIAAACTAIGGLQPKGARLSAARAEMGVRVVQLALAAEEPSARLAHLLRALNLPPDCTAHALHKITSDLAEQASELCIESATSSPLSSHHRTAAAI